MREPLRVYAAYPDRGGAQRSELLPFRFSPLRLGGPRGPQDLRGPPLPARRRIPRIGATEGQPFLRPPFGSGRLSLAGQVTEYKEIRALRRRIRHGLSTTWRGRCLVSVKGIARQCVLRVLAAPVSCVLSAAQGCARCHENVVVAETRVSGRDREPERQ